MEETGWGVNGGDGGGVSIYPLICKKKKPPPPCVVAIRGQGNLLHVHEALMKSYVVSGYCARERK